MAQISKRSYDEVAAAIRKMKDCVIADPATSHLLIAVITMQKEISRSFSENNSAFRPDRFATACEPLFKPGRMGKQAAPATEKRPIIEALQQMKSTLQEWGQAETQAEADARAQKECDETVERVEGAVASLATARYGDSSKPRTGERRTIGRADLYGRDRRKQKPD